MPIQPRTQQQIYEDVKDELASRTDSMTNFVEGSFNDQFIRSYAEQIHELELKALAAELSGYIDFAGRELTAEDLEQIGIENVDPDAVNKYIEDVQLDALAANVGVVRDPGERATGTVTFDVSDDTVTVPQGYTVATEPDSTIAGLEFKVDPTGTGTIDFDNTVTASPDPGESTITVDVLAVEPGKEYNLSSGKIEHLPNPKPGVQSVTNTVPTSGGVDEQSQGSLRDTAKSALFESSDGGTRSGIKTVIEDESESEVRSVSLNEFTDVQPPYVDVIVDGGDTEEIQMLISESKPWGIEYNLVRPTILSVGVHTNVLGSGIDTSAIDTSIAAYFGDFTIGDPFYMTDLLNDMSLAEDAINSIPALNTYYNIVERENYQYSSGTTTYELAYGPFGRVREEEHYVNETNSYSTVFSNIVSSSVSVEVVTDDTADVLPDGSVSVTDSTGNGNYDTVELADSVSVDPGTTVTINYNHNNWSVDSVELRDGTTFEQGVDYELIDDSGDGLVDSIHWLGNTTPDDGQKFNVTYRPYRSFIGDHIPEDQTKIDVDASGISIETI